ncbi:MAG: ribonuclease E/G [Eubacterium sp.]|nr:ribonuclease E/G [Eubacterium sp.]
MNPKRLILTNMPVQNREMLVCAVFEKESGRLEDFFLYPPSESMPSPGEIYVGKIDRIHRQTEGAFVRLSGKQMVYLPLRGKESCDDYVMKTRRERGAKLRTGDELLLQIDVTAQKTKLPRADGELNLPGRYLAVTTRDPGWHYSRKLPAEAKSRIRQIFESNHCAPEQFGVIVRTHAEEAAEADLTAEFADLAGKLKTILAEGRVSPAGSCLMRTPASWAHLLDRISFEPETVIETDRPELMEQIREMTHTGASQPVLSMYRDPVIPLYQLYRLKSHLDRLTARRVWLKSGASVIIEPTEAFVSVDVNSGKFTGNLGREEMARRINLEAAPEILRQLRLRQLSGTILVDFINMNDPAHTRELMQCLKDAAADDPVRTSVIDMTALGIVEITREKRFAPLAEQIRINDKSL